MRSTMPGLATLLCVLAVGGCARDTKVRPGDSGKNETLRIAVMPKLVGISYFESCRKGAEEAAKELGVDLRYDGPTADRVQDQVEMIELWIAEGYDVIAVAPNDPEVIAPVLKRAKEQGIYVITWDADANPTTSQRTVFVNQAPTESIGNKLADIMAEAIGGKGKTVIVTGSATSPNQNAWMKVMEKRLADKYPKIELLETIVPNEDQSRARQLTAAALTAHPDMAGIWGLTSVALPGAAEAVRQSGKSGKVYVTGLSEPRTVKDYVKDGTVPKLVLWSPVDLGYLTIHVAKRVAEGTLTEGEQSMGRLEGIRVTDGEVILGPPIVFDKSNIDDVDF